MKCIKAEKNKYKIKILFFEKRQINEWWAECMWKPTFHYIYNNSQTALFAKKLISNNMNNMVQAHRNMHSSILHNQL